MKHIRNLDQRFENFFPFVNTCCPNLKQYGELHIKDNKTALKDKKYEDFKLSNLPLIPYNDPFPNKEQYP
jgi:hypothetical protein